MGVSESGLAPSGLELPRFSGVGEILAISRRAGYDLSRSAAQQIKELTAERVLIEANRPRAGLGRCVLIGAFSWLLETIRSAKDPSEPASAAGIALAERYLEINPIGHGLLNESSVVALDRQSLTRFAETIALNDYNWLDFSIAFLDPEEARRDRLRQNLRLSPTERWKRHQNLMRQLIAIRDVKSGNRT